MFTGLLNPLSKRYMIFLCEKSKRKESHRQCTFNTSPDNGTSAVAEVEEPRAIDVENRVEARSVPVKVHHGILLLIQVLHIFFGGQKWFHGHSFAYVYRPVHLFLARVCWPLLMSPILYFFERCLDSNPKSCRIANRRATNLDTHLPT